MNTKGKKYNLVIVESPAKIKSIEKYLGSGYVVKASVGHIATLPSTGEERFGVDLQTWTPNYKIDPKKKDVVDELKIACKDAEIVYIATDPDREGEAIGQHLVDFLHIESKYKRIRFNEITKDRVIQAVEHPTMIDVPLVESQTARRILDRIIGYRLSNLMRNKVENTPTNPSAGRVQSIALELVVEREKEIEAFVPTEYYSLEAKILNNFTATYFEGHVEDEDVASDENVANDIWKPNWIRPDAIERIYASLTGSMTVANVKITDRRDAKLTPLKQSALYKKGDSMLQLSSSSIKRAAQKLYEGYGDGGLISYPRTDSTRLSDTFVESAKKYIADTFGKNYVASDVKGTAGSQDAHEAIRPTDISLTPEMAKVRFNLEESEYKVYKLIYIHTLQVLMEVPIRKVTRYDLKDGNINFKLSGSIITFDGYFKATGYDKNSQLPILAVGDVIKVESYEKEQHFTKPPARFNDGSLIETLDNVGVGRPSTFSTTVETLREREYVNMEGRALVPTTFGRLIYEKLMEGFPKIMDIAYTAGVEEKLDSIADGNTDYKELLDRFWTQFDENFQHATTEISITRLSDIPAGKDCPLCGHPLVVKKNKATGQKFFACSNFPTCKHTESDPNDKTSKFKFFRKKK